MVGEMMEDWETVMAEGLINEEMMVAMMELIMDIDIHTMGKIAEVLVVEK